MNYENELLELNTKKDKLSKELSNLEGEYNLLDTQIKETEIKLQKIDSERLKYKKSIEFLRKVEESTKTKIKEGFENLISYAMRSICQEDYSFKFEFNKRGNSQELKFLIKTPECQEYHDPIDSQAGGVLDVMGVSLRIALIEKIKLKGLLAFDESFKALDKNHLQYAGKFLSLIHKRIGKQIVFVTHKKELADYAENKIELKKEE